MTTLDSIVKDYECLVLKNNPDIIKKKGIYYTPKSVTDFIIRSVDDILKSEFGLRKGIASQDSNIEFLDPALGTGTFLTELINFIYNKNYKNKPKEWNLYVQKTLLPSLSGFEIIRSSYALSLLNIESILFETGYTMRDDDKLNIFLCNSLEEKIQKKYFNKIKNRSKPPILCVIGNPPYNINSKNKNDYLKLLLNDYNKEPGEKNRLKEVNKSALIDDYVKFIRVFQNYIMMNKKGILAFISNNNFIDSIVMRGMRWCLLDHFDIIYILNLHGNSLSIDRFLSDGSIDKSIFDIRIGTSINIFVKNNSKPKAKLANVKYLELLGSRDSKHNELMKIGLK